MNKEDEVAKQFAREFKLRIVLVGWQVELALRDHEEDLLEDGGRLETGVEERDRVLDVLAVCVGLVILGLTEDGASHQHDLRESAYLAENRWKDGTRKRTPSEVITSKSPSVQMSSSRMVSADGGGEVVVDMMGDVDEEVWDVEGRSGMCSELACWSVSTDSVNTQRSAFSAISAQHSVTTLTV